MKSQFLSSLLGTTLLIVSTGASALPFSYSCSECPLEIANNELMMGTTVSTFTVADSNLIEDLNVSINLNHGWTGDLDIQLSHNGTTVQLFNRLWGTDIYNVVFDDEASTSITTADGANGFGPGSFRPDTGLLSAFDGMDLAGDWTLTITDLEQDIGGMLFRWGIAGETVDSTSVPEPSSIALIGLGLAAFGLVRLRQKKAE